MDDKDLWPHVGVERHAIVDTLRHISAPEWLAPSLCDGWRVRDVAAHLLVDEPWRELGAVRVAFLMARNRLDIHRINALWVDHCRDWPTERIITASVAAIKPGRMARAIGPAGCLRATVIHHADITRSLGLPDTASAERVRAVLGILDTPGGSTNLGSAERMAGLRLVATDLDWATGDGPQVSGPGMSLVLALGGRPAALPDLAGDGLKTLADRVLTPAAAATPGRIAATLRNIHSGTEKRTTA